MKIFLLERFQTILNNLLPRSAKNDPRETKNYRSKIITELELEIKSSRKFGKKKDKKKTEHIGLNFSFFEQKKIG